MEKQCLMLKYEGSGDIEFESTNTDALSIIEGSRPTIRARSEFEGDEIDVDVIITSSKDKNFRKVVTFTVRKVYPDEESFKANYFLESGAWNVAKIKVGMKIYPYSNADDNNYTNEYELIYDREYIRYDKDSGAYIAVKETPQGMPICFAVRYPNGAIKSSRSFEIVPYTDIEDFDEIRVMGEAVEEIFIDKNKSFVPRLYKDGKVISSKIEVSINDVDGVELTKSYHYKFKEIGDYRMTFTLPNGFSRTLDVHVRNVIAEPELKSSAKIEGNRITVVNSDEPVKVNFVYPKGVTLTDPIIEYDGDAAKIKDLSQGFSVTPKKVGEVTLRVVWDDGYERLEQSYTVEVVKNTSLAYHIKNGIGLYVSKILGHSAFFVCLAFFALNMFKYLDIENKALKIALYIASSFPTAILTEVIQMFQPARYARFSDVMIDVGAFLVGTVIWRFVAAGKRKMSEM